MGDIDLKQVAIEIILILVLAFGIFFVVGMVTSANKNYEIEEISEKEYKYFAVYTEGKYGVIDEEGKIIVKNEYTEITIPNPTKAVFICKKSDGKTDILNQNNEKIFGEFKNVEAIETSGNTSPWPYEKSVLKYEENREIWINKL